MKPGLGDDLLDSGIKSFNHAIGLRMPWSDKAVFDLMFLADQVKWMVAGGFPLARGTKSIGKLLAIVSENDLDLKRGLTDQIAEETCCGFRGLGCPDLEIDPASGSIDGDKEIFTPRLIRHLGQILEVGMYVSGLILFEIAECFLLPFLFRDQVGQP